MTTGRPRTTLFEPDRHEPVRGTAWDASAARAAIRRLCRDIEHERTAQGHWPVHALDADGDTPATGFQSLYLGSAGLHWALWHLQREGAVTLALDPLEGIERAEAAYRLAPDTGSVVPSYLLGEVGILLVRWRLGGEHAVADRLHAAVESNIANPTNEALWAAPGTMLAAWHLWSQTGEDRWRDLYLRNAEHVLQQWQFDAHAQCHLWTQDMYGKVLQYLGAGHGFAGNAYALLKGASLFTEGRRATLHERCLATLRATAVGDGGAVNWPARTQDPRPEGPRLLMQWCHGSPGIVTSFADFPPGLSAEMDALLIAAGEAVWRAGPLTKGYGLCHGTAGNGYAFLTLYRRTGDATWLERARAFAMHAIEQQARMRRQHGMGRHSLWTGDAGLALFLWHCIGGASGMPGLDVIG